MTTVALVFTGPRAFVTDLGESPLDLVAPDGTIVANLPRYGVWAYDAAKGKHQVMLTTDNRDEAILAATVLR